MGIESGRVNSFEGIEQQRTAKRGGFEFFP